MQDYKLGAYWSSLVISLVIHLLIGSCSIVTRLTTLFVVHFCFKMEYLLIAVLFSLLSIQPIILILGLPCSFHPSILLCILSLTVEPSLNMCPIQFHCLHGIILVRQLLSSAILRTSSADFCSVQVTYISSDLFSTVLDVYHMLPYSEHSSAYFCMAFHVVSDETSQASVTLFYHSSYLFV